MRRSRLAARHCTGTRAGHGSAMSQPPPDVEAVAGPSGCTPQNELESSGLLDSDLVQEIMNHPVLYKNAVEENEVRIQKKKVWADICRTLFKNWTSYSQQNKLLTIKEIQRRWIKLKDEFFKRQAESRPASPPHKKTKSIFDSMGFLLQSTVAQDLDMASSHNDFAPILDHCDPLTQGTPETDINLGISTLLSPSAFNLAMPSTSSVAQPEPIQDNPNVHFSLMLVPLLNKLSSDQLYTTWSEILRVIKEAEGSKKLQILQQELIYPPGVQPGLEPEPDPAEDPAEEEESVYPSSHGRPRNPEGEIMYPTTDNEDDEL